MEEKKDSKEKQIWFRLLFLKPFQRCHDTQYNGTHPSDIWPYYSMNKLWI
jgi:hypothetical protein